MKLQMEADKKSVDALAKELETVKKDQARQRAESIAQHEKQQKAQQLAEEKHKKFLSLTDANMSRVSKTFKGMEKKQKEELKDQWTEDRFEEVKKPLKPRRQRSKPPAPNVMVHPTHLVALLRRLRPRRLHHLLLSPLVQALSMNLLSQAKQERKRRRK